MQAQVEKARAAQQKPIPLFQIIAMKLFEGGLGGVRGDAVVVIPTDGANAAVVVSLALESGLAKRQSRNSGNGPRREHRDGDALVARVAASDARNSC